MFKPWGPFLFSGFGPLAKVDPADADFFGPLAKFEGPLLMSGSGPVNRKKIRLIFKSAMRAWKYTADVSFLLSPVPSHLKFEQLISVRL